MILSTPLFALASMVSISMFSSKWIVLVHLPVFNPLIITFLSSLSIESANESNSTSITSSLSLASISISFLGIPGTHTLR